MLYLFTFQIKLPRQMMEFSPQLTQLSYPQDFYCAAFCKCRKLYLPCLCAVVLKEDVAVTSPCSAVGPGCFTAALQLQHCLVQPSRAGEKEFHSRTCSWSTGKFSLHPQCSCCMLVWDISVGGMWEHVGARGAVVLPECLRAEKPCSSSHPQAGLLSLSAGWKGSTSCCQLASALLGERKRVSHPPATGRKHS